jgi:hypothetical protein
MRWLGYLLAVAIASCTSFSRERAQQSKIDSLTNELKKRDSAIKKDVIVQEQVKKDTVIVEETSDAGKNSDVKENVAKKKEQKNTLLKMKELMREKRR